MYNPLAPRPHLEVFVNDVGAIEIKSAMVENGDVFEESVYVPVNQVDDLIVALQYCKAEIEAKK